MLVYNFKRAFKARGVERPFSFLKKAGFSDNFASKVKNNKTVRLEMKQLEQLCVLLHCTPNDLLEWTPEKLDNIGKDHPMNLIRKPEREVDLTKTLNTIPLGQISEIEELILEKINRNSPHIKGG